MIDVQTHTRLPNGYYLLEDDLYYNWTKIEGHAGYVVSGLNKQLAPHGLKIIFGKFKHSPDDLYGMVVPIDLPENTDIKVTIDMTDPKNQKFSAEPI